MRKLENIPEMQSVPRRLSKIVTLERLVGNYGQLSPRKSLPFLNQKLVLQDIISLHAKRRKTFFIPCINLLGIEQDMPEQC